MQTETNESKPARVDPLDFAFHVEGHGVKVPCAPVHATREQDAIKEVLKQCRRFRLPGWTLVCETTGTCLPVVEFQGVDGDGNKTKTRM